MIFRRNYNGRRLCRWSSASCKHTCPSRIPAALSGAASRRDWSLQGRKQAEYLFFNQEGAISTLNCGPLKLDNFTFLDRSVSSPERDTNIRLAKTWIAIDWLSIICKSDLSDKIKRDVFLAAVVSVLLYGCTTWTLTKRREKKATWKLHKNVTS